MHGEHGVSASITHWVVWARTQRQFSVIYRVLLPDSSAYKKNALMENTKKTPKAIPGLNADIPLRVLRILLLRLSHEGSFNVDNLHTN